MTSNRDQLEAIEDICRYQLRRGVHPLTCGNDSTHNLLFPAVEDSTGKLILACPDCDYRQNHIPLDLIRSAGAYDGR